MKKPKKKPKKGSVCECPCHIFDEFRHSKPCCLHPGEPNPALIMKYALDPNFDPEHTNRG